LFDIHFGCFGDNLFQDKTQFDDASLSSPTCIKPHVGGSISLR
jgi:hypothetical protein